MIPTAQTLLTEYIDPEHSEPDTPNIIEIRANADGEAVLWFGFDRGVFHVPLAEFEDVTDDEDALEPDILEDGPALFCRARNGQTGYIQPHTIHVNVIYDFHVRELDTGDQLMAEYYSLGENYVNDTQQTSWHLNCTVDREEITLLYTD